MGLRGRLIILVVGIFLLPPLTIGVFVALGQNLLPGFTDNFVNPISWTQTILLREVDRSINSQKFTHLEHLLKPGGFVVVDPGGALIYTSPNLTIRSHDQLERQLLKPLSTDIQSYSLKRNGAIWRLFVFRPATGLLPENEQIYPLLPVIGIASMLVFILFMSLLILRGINASITRLVRATRHIAEGNLDFELKITGNDYLASLARSMETMRQRLKEEYARRDRFIMAVSHDLKTPLAVIDGYLDAFAEGFAETPEKRQEFLNIIREKTAILTHRVAHLIELARMTTIEWRQTLVPTDLQEWLLSTLAVFQEEARIQAYKLDCDLQFSHPLIIPMNQDMVQRILENLLINARNYSHRGSSIAVSTWNTADYAFISISNSGEGIPANQIKLIFEPFFRADSGRNRDGFGLGLASVKSIVDMHGWSITAESVPGQTTSFTLEIPLTNYKGQISDKPQPF